MFHLYRQGEYGGLVGTLDIQCWCATNSSCCVFPKAKLLDYPLGLNHVSWIQPCVLIFYEKIKFSLQNKEMTK